MNSLLVCVLLLLQGIPVQQGGTVTGVLRDRQGKPLQGVRMAAVARGGPVEEAATGASMAGLAETDEQGRFTLENVPPGRYSIAAGRLDLQTYYPGTQVLESATILTIAPGAMVSGITFALNDASFGRAEPLAQIAATIPMRITVEGGEKLPVYADGNPIFVELQSPAIAVPSIRIDGASFRIPGPTTGDFRVIVGNLPDTYEVKSVRYGTTDVTKGTFHLAPSNFTTSLNIPTPLSASTLIGLPSGTTIGVTISGANGALRPAATPPSGLSIMIGTVTRPFIGGVRVSGRLAGANTAVYLSGRPGITFSDGSFEFIGVEPGRHVVGSNYGRLGAVVVVGSSDLDGVELKEKQILPSDVRKPKDPLPAGSYSPGDVVPLAHISGIVLDEETMMPISEANLAIQSEARVLRIPIQGDGRFETFDLLPGSYNLRLEVFGHSTRDVTVAIDDKNLNVELTTRPLK